MSKNHRNYTQYSNKQDKPEFREISTESIVEETVTDSVTETIPEVISETIPEVINEAPAIEEPTVKPNIIGKVVKCRKLNVRKMPNPAAEILEILDVGTKVEIDEEKSTVEYYKVCNGYCMKKFIDLV